MCVALIVNIRDTLMESDFSMCLASLLSYTPPDDTGVVITLAVDLKKRVSAVAWHHIGEDELMTTKKGGANSDDELDFDFDSNFDKLKSAEIEEARANAPGVGQIAKDIVDEAMPQPKDS